MTSIRQNLSMIVATMVMFGAALLINELLFKQLEFAEGINWIYLPAGVRLLATLLFAEAGAIGLLLVSWLYCAILLFPNEPVRAFAGGILSSLAPYLVYLGAKRWLDLQGSLANLTPFQMLACAVAYSLASPLLHHIWFALYEGREQLLGSFAVMAMGDFFGTVLLLFFTKWVMRLSMRR
ncbi:hypothetical protein [Pseudoduganella sp. OTU4001]|uniref:hypothetical protein n=1 Tax=Pseudoduganella sp. OTU4001 TaxID=3043854 RepID=UPI00313EE76F